MTKNEDSGASQPDEQSEQGTPQDVFSPNQEKKVSTENMVDEIHFRCKPDPANPGVFRCRVVQGKTVLKGTDKVPPASWDSPVREPTTAGPQAPVAETVETWTRPDGTSIQVRHLQQNGNEMFMVVKDIPASSLKDQHRVPSQAPAEVASHRVASPLSKGCDSGLCMDDGDEQPIGRKQDNPRR